MIVINAGSFWLRLFVKRLLTINAEYIFKTLFCLILIDRENSNNIQKFNLRTERVEATISVSGFSARKNYYQWNGNTGMDLAVDEQGLWALWGSTGNSGKLYASKIDVFRNVVTQTWGLNSGKYKIFTSRTLSPITL